MRHQLIRCYLKAGLEIKVMMDAPGVPLQDPLLELAARADAGQKLGMQALEFVNSLAQRQGLTVDFRGAAQAMEAFDTSRLDPQAAAIERRSRGITAGVLRHFADQTSR